MVEGRNSSGGICKSTNSCDGFMVAIRSDVKTTPSSLVDSDGNDPVEEVVVVFFVVVLVASSTVRSNDRADCDGDFRFRVVVAVVVSVFFGDGVTGTGLPALVPAAIPAAASSTVSEAEVDDEDNEREVTEESCGSAS